MLRNAMNVLRRPLINHGRTTTAPLRGLEEFRSLSAPTKGEKVIVGSDWKAWMLREKSTEDLQKLWFVLLKERNALLTERAEAKFRGELMQDPERRTKVKKSMARIKFILHERSIKYKADQAKVE